MKPKIGIVIASYQRLRFLQRAVQSCLEQTYNNLEILVIDDHSPDHRISAYLRSISASRFHHQINRTNRGVTKNYDSGVRALGKNVSWCLILDNDDYLAPECIEQLVKFTQKNTSTSVIHARQIFVDKKENIISEDRDYPEIETAEDYFIERANNRREIRSSAIFFSKKRFVEIGGYPQFATGLCTDSAFIFGLSFNNQLAYAKNARIFTTLHDEAESSLTNDLPKRFESILQMKNYIKKISPNSKLMNDLAYYEQRLIATLLAGKYRELLLDKPLIKAHREFIRTVKKAKKNNTPLSIQNITLGMAGGLCAFIAMKLKLPSPTLNWFLKVGSRITPIWLTKTS